MLGWFRSLAEAFELHFQFPEASAMPNTTFDFRTDGGDVAPSPDIDRLNVESAPELIEAISEHLSRCGIYFDVTLDGEHNRLPMRPYASDFMEQLPEAIAALSREGIARVGIYEQGIELVFDFSCNDTNPTLTRSSPATGSTTSEPCPLPDALAILLKPMRSFCALTLRFWPSAAAHALFKSWMSPAEQGAHLVDKFH